ncbi:MAG: hypothetical protein ACLRWP_01400 [Bilophila wadsworthia]
MSAFRTRLDGFGQYAEFVEAAQVSVVLAEDAVQLVQDARAGQFFHEVQGQGVLMSSPCVLNVPLLKAHGPMMRVGSPRSQAWMMRIVLR